MRILFLTPGFPPGLGGGERYVRSLALSLRRYNHAVTILTSMAETESAFWLGSGDGSPQMEDDDGVIIIRCPVQKMPGGYPALMAWRKLMVMLGALPTGTTAVLNRMAVRVPHIPQLTAVLHTLPRPHLIHGFNLSWESPLMAGWQAAHQWRVPFVVTPFAHFGGGGRRDRVAMNNTMPHQRRLLNDADVVMTLTDVEAANLRRYGIQPGRFETIGGGLDAIPPLPELAAVTRRFGLTPPFVCFVGRASYDKGAIHALQAVLAVNRNRKRPCTLVFIGQSAPELEQALDRLDNGERTAARHLGRLSESDKHALLAAGEMLLLPSRTDSFGIVFLEAWAHGKPVIGADAGGIPGVVDDGLNGLLVPFGDVNALAEAIERLLAEPQLRQTLGEHGRQKAATKYNWEQVGERVHQIYRELLAERS